MGHDDFRAVSVRRAVMNDGACEDGEDEVAREEPLEIRWAGASLAVVMRTPGDDLELVRGFLHTEGIALPHQVASVRHCTVVEAPEAEDNVVLVTPADGVALELERFRRNMYATSSCGVCGKASLAQALRVGPAIDDETKVAARALTMMAERLRDAQPTFARTGGLHGAALFTPSGELVVAREDVGRHNAVDKVVGARLSQDQSCAGLVLMVSGRVSFELVQKALAARIPIIAAVSAPSSLAVELGRAANLTVVGFVRQRRVCVYSAEGRVLI